MDTSLPTHATAADLAARLDTIAAAPRDDGRLLLIARRPARDAREVLESAELDLGVGLVGDNWSTRGSSRTADGSAHPEMQLTLMNARAIAAIAGDERFWPLAGDQLYVDLDLSESNLPAGTRLAIGEAVVAVTDQPHTGCKKFAARFGIAATQFINSPAGRALRLRGINTRVVRPGRIRVGDRITRPPAP